MVLSTVPSFDRSFVEGRRAKEPVGIVTEPVSLGGNPQSVCIEEPIVVFVVKGDDGVSSGRKLREDDALRPGFRSQGCAGNTPCLRQQRARRGAAGDRELERVRAIVESYEYLAGVRVDAFDRNGEICSVNGKRPDRS